MMSKLPIPLSIQDFEALEPLEGFLCRFTIIVSEWLPNGFLFGTPGVQEFGSDKLGQEGGGSTSPSGTDPGVV